MKHVFYLMPYAYLWMFGVLQVMEILADNLETESSLHRRVDLFFLVDSIAQFSRGLKGNLFIALLLESC
jgi:hypothetical protein